MSAFPTAFRTLLQGGLAVLTLSACGTPSSPEELKPFDVPFLTEVSPGLFPIGEAAGEEKVLRLRWEAEEEHWTVSLSRQGETLLPPVPISPYSFPLGQGVRVLDFNRNGRQDILVTTYGGGNGLMAVYQHLTIILNLPDGYKVQVLTLFEDPERNLYLLGDQPVILRRGLHNGTDRQAAYWSEHLLKAEAGRILPVDNPPPGFSGRQPVYPEFTGQMPPGAPAPPPLETFFWSPGD